MLSLSVCHDGRAAFVSNTTGWVHQEWTEHTHHALGRTADVLLGTAGTLCCEALGGLHLASLAIKRTGILLCSTPIQRDISIGHTSHAICAVLWWCKSKFKRCLQHSCCPLKFIFLYCMHSVPGVRCWIKLCAAWWEAESWEILTGHPRPIPPLAALRTSTNRRIHSVTGMDFNWDESLAGLHK